MTHHFFSFIEYHLYSPPQDIRRTVLSDVAHIHPHFGMPKHTDPNLYQFKKQKDEPSKDSSKCFFPNQLTCSII